MTKPAAFRQDDLTRALKGAAAAGVQVAKIELEPGGKIVIFTGSSQPGESGGNPLDRVFGK